MQEEVTPGMVEVPQRGGGKEMVVWTSKQGGEGGELDGVVPQ